MYASIRRVRSASGCECNRHSFFFFVGFLLVLTPQVHSAGAGFFVSDQATFWSRKTPYSLGGVVGWKGPWGRPLERVPGNVVLWLCAILMAVEMVVANGSFCFLVFGPEKESNPGPWILGPTEIACATNWAISAFPQLTSGQYVAQG